MNPLPTQSSQTPRPGARAAGRQLALQTLYQWSLRGDAFAGEVQAFLDEQTADADIRRFALSLAEGCRQHQADIDARIAGVAEHWDLRRMAAIDACILRLASFEMMYCSDIPPKVSINEAVRLAKKFSTAGSGAFVNGILDALMALLRADDSADRPQTKGT